MISSPNSLIKYDEINVFTHQHLSKTEPKKFYGADK